MSWSSEVTADAPVAWWRLGTNTGNADLVDSSSGGTHTLTKTGTPTEVNSLVASDANKAHDFPGATTDYYQAADANDLDFSGNAAFSLEAWANCDTNPTNYQRIVSHDDATQGWILFLHQTDGYGIGRRVAGTFTLCKYKPTTFLNLPFHVVGTYDGTNLRLYLNGVLVAGPTTASASMGTIAQVCRIGRDSAGGGADVCFNGILDEIAVYSTALSATRVSAHYAAALATNFVTADFVLPWSTTGAAAINTLGSVPSTQTVPRVWEGFARDPIATDDQTTLGVAAGDIWIGLASSGWLCTSAATSAAVWRKVTP